MAKKVSYEEKIERIFDNILEFNGNHEESISKVKNWLYCEWYCSSIEMEECSRLLNLVDDIALRKIKEL